MVTTPLKVERQRGIQADESPERLTSDDLGINTPHNERYIILRNDMHLRKSQLTRKLVDGSRGCPSLRPVDSAKDRPKEKEATVKMTSLLLQAIQKKILTFLPRNNNHVSPSLMSESPYAKRVS